MKKMKNMKNILKELETVEKKASIVCSIRVDVKDLARFALAINEQKNYPDTLGKLVSKILPLFGSVLDKIFPILSYAQALNILETLGYGEQTRNNPRFDQLLGLIKTEIKMDEDRKSFQEVIDRFKG